MTSTLRDCDVAIVGGGPAGIATALFAVEADASLRDRLVVLEKARYPREKICAGAIGGRADRLLATIGVTVDVPSAPVSGLSIRASGGALLERLDRPIGRVVRRIEFDHALAEVARARGIRVVEDARVTGLSVDAKGVRLETSQGALAARAVVGADGVGSYVRRAIGAPRGRLSAQVVEVDTDPVASDQKRDLLHFDVADRSLVGYAWDFPTIVGGEELVCRGVYELAWEESESPADGPDVAARLAQRLDAIGVRPRGRVKRFAERGLSLGEPVAYERVLLVGEAAGIDPVLGEGIAQAIQYGATAGGYLATALARGDLLFRDWRSTLMASRVGWDLSVRSRAVRLFYGSSRPVAERWVTTSRNLAVSGMRYFAGEHVPRGKIVAAAADLARCAVTAR